MGMSEITTWVLFRRYDKLESESSKVQSNYYKLILTSEMMWEDIKACVFQAINLPDDGKIVLKFRRHDNNLVPHSTLLSGSTKEKPYIIDVVLVHQFCPVEERTVPEEYVEAFRKTCENFEKRVKIIEEKLPNLGETKKQKIQESIEEMSNLVNFLNRRIDELTPPEWKKQIDSGQIDK